jgi:hypothetical protein
MRYILFALISSFAFAQDNAENQSIMAVAPYSIPKFAYGLILIISGIVLTFGGIQLMRITLILSGFILFSVLTNIFSEHSNLGDQIAFITTICGGLLGSFISGSFPVIGETILGLSGGLSFAFIILSSKPGGEWNNITPPALFIILFASTGAMVIHAVRKTAIIVSSSLLGSYIVFNGLIRINVVAEHTVYNSLALVLVLSLIGSLVQFLLYWRLSADVISAPERLEV